MKSTKKNENRSAKSIRNHLVLFAKFEKTSFYDEVVTKYLISCFCVKGTLEKTELSKTESGKIQSGRPGRPSPGSSLDIPKPGRSTP